METNIKIIKWLNQLYNLIVLKKKIDGKKSSIYLPGVY